MENAKISSKLFDQSGKSLGEIELSSEVFGQEYNEAVVHSVVVALQNNLRQGTKRNLTRTEVRGGGAKPYRQKGTGRARQGSTRAPQWIKGGVVFAARPRDFSQKVNRKVKLIAIKSALSQKLRDEEIIFIDKLNFEPKTKNMASVLEAFKVYGDKVLLVLESQNQDVLRAARNIENLTIISPELINVLEVVKNKVCLITKESVSKIEEAYNG